jgi:MoxR-like ATPase
LVIKPQDGAVLARGLDVERIGTERLLDPAKYVPDPDAEAAVEVAKILHQPLLVTGPPGVGKSQLAAWIAQTENCQLIRFTAKSTTAATDLLYRFDAVRQFRELQIGAIRNEPEPPVSRYLTFQALGRAIALTYAADSSEMKALWDERANRPPGAQRSREHEYSCSSVVLIDEIDKAPRDVPNDLLVEFDTKAFQIPEASQELSVQGKLYPIVIATSNSEKALPDAFLRRCIFLNMTIPKPETLRKIIQTQLHEVPEGSPVVTDALQVFDALHSDTDSTLYLRRKPSVAELLGWLLFAAVSTVHAAKFCNQGLREGLKSLPIEEGKRVFLQWLSILFKTQDDLREGQGWLCREWQLGSSFAPPPAPV